MKCKCKRCGCQDIEFTAGDVTCAPIETSQTEKDLSALKRHLVFGIIPQEPADSMARLILKLYEERLGYQRNPGL